MKLTPPDSWYQATAHQRPEVVRAEGQINTEVCIIGGGFTGLSAALSLAEQGRQVIILEARRIGWGASGRNGGQMIRGLVGEQRIRNQFGDDLTDELRWMGNDLIRERVSKYQIECDLQNGWTELAISGAQEMALQYEYQERMNREPDRGWQLIEKSEVKQTYGTDRYRLGLVSHSDGHLHPLNLCLGLAEACIKNGVQIYEQSPVINIAEGSPNQISLQQAEIEAEHLVLAANAFHHIKGFKHQSRVLSLFSNMMVTEPLEKAVIQELNAQRHALCDMNKICDYFRVTADNRVLFGGRAKHSLGRYSDIQKVLMPRMLRVWPQLKNCSIDYQWGGKLAIPALETPVVGRTQKNLWFAYGYTGHGLNMANTMGNVIAQAIGSETDLFEKFASMPTLSLPFGQCGRAGIMSLAMMYYRLRDAG